AARDHSDASHGTRLVAIEDLRCRERIEQGEADVLIAVGAGANAKDVVLRAPLIGKAGQEVPVLGRRTTDSAAQFKLEVEHFSLVFVACTLFVYFDSSLSVLIGHIVVKHYSSADFGGDPPWIEDAVLLREIILGLVGVEDTRLRKDLRRRCWFGFGFLIEGDG